MAVIEYFYAAHSAFAYLGSARLMQIVQASGATLRHRPMDLRRVVPASGSTPTTERTPGHRAYFFGREIQRWSEERGAPVVAGLPTYHHHDIDLPNRFLIAAGEQGEAIDRLAHALLEAHWRDDADLADADTLVRLADGLGQDGAALLAAARDDATGATYERFTAEAIARSVFGSPTYFVDGDMFYGQDRLELVERALRQPYRR
ncbi:MAG: 2-hydroxychromene-2-carboxylate isomerase [Alphaproteobacteria bacterium]|nr:2-hydroxychromene-2-carboxylate isomerase [Alphaproteobacteria bacterium]MCB9928107.1 2-hydroxychromene-2-carboxylate isomerase [Alphaproteobacteria bacterium]